MRSKLLNPSHVFLLLLSAFFIFATTPYPVYLSYNEKRIFQLGIVSLLAIAALLHRPTRENIQAQLLALPKFAQIALSALAVLAVLSSIHADDPRLSFRGLFLYLGLLILFFGISDIRSRNSSLFDRVVLSSLVIGAFLLEAPFFLIYIAALLHQSSLIFPEPFSGFENIRFFNQYQVGTVFLLILPLVIYPNISRFFKTLIFLINAGWWVMLFYLAGRGSIASILLAPILAWLLLGNRARPFIFQGITVAVSGALIYAVLFYFIPSLVDFDFLSGGRTLDQALQAGSRPYIWKSALDYATQSPILGIGLGTTRYGYYIVAHPHNSVLQWAAELGLLSVGIILATISLSIFRWIKAVRHSNMAPNAESDFSHAALLAAIIGMLGYSLVSGVIVMPLSQTILVLISGWMLSAVWDRKTTDISLTFSNKGNIVFGMSILLIAGFIVTLLPDFELLLHSSYEQQFYGPKFWGQSTIP